jgi:hypothetical protein
VSSHQPPIAVNQVLSKAKRRLAAEAAELAPTFRRDAANLAARDADLAAPLLDANRAAWKVPLGVDRYIGRTEA